MPSKKSSLKGAASLAHYTNASAIGMTFDLFLAIGF